MSDDAYQPFDQDEKLGPPPWSVGPALTAWETAHGHDVRLKCYVEFGCQVIVSSLESKRDALLAEVERLTRERDEAHRTIRSINYQRDLAAGDE